MSNTETIQKNISSQIGANVSDVSTKNGRAYFSYNGILFSAKLNGNKIMTTTQIIEKL